MRATRHMMVLFLAGAGVSGCSQHRDYVPPTPESAPIYLVQIVGGEIDPTRPDGQPWDLEEQRRAPSGITLTTPLGNLSLSLTGTPARAVTVPGAPDTVVTLTFAGRRVETPPSPDSFNPSWGYSFLIDPSMDPDAPITVQVADEDGDHRESMGSLTISMHDLLSQPVMQFAPFGSVRHLQISVTRESSEKFAPFETSPIEVSATVGGWINTGVQVYSGMHVAIAAEGRVRLSRLTTGYWGPEGVTDPTLVARWQAHNVSGFETAPHGALIAAVVDPTTQAVTQRLTVGDGVLTRLDGSGVLLLGVNDTDASNNAGAFQVRVGCGVRVPMEAVARPAP